MIINCKQRLIWLVNNQLSFFLVKLLAKIRFLKNIGYNLFVGDIYD